jgi:hypothetical protein
MQHAPEGQFPSPLQSTVHMSPPHVTFPRQLLSPEQTMLHVLA